jgi:hypothetical protein
MSEKLEEKLSVTEEPDGSVTVDMPGVGDVNEADDDSGDEGPVESPRAEADGDYGDADQPGDSDSVREARRNRRKAKKEYIKRTNEEKDQRLVMLQRQNQDLLERISVVERKTHDSDLARLDKAIEDEELRLRYADAKKREAINSSDGEGFNKAQELWYEARRKAEALRALKNRAVQSTSNDTGAVNPRLQQYAGEWMERNSWYDPQAKDEDSQIAKVVDQRLISEGWDPSSSEYWGELDRRLQKRLPHCYNGGTENLRRSRPRSVVTGSGRESGGVGGDGRNSLVLSADQVRAMKEAGFWDDPEKRARMIKRYANDARTNRG